MAEYNSKFSNFTISFGTYPLRPFKEQQFTAPVSTSNKYVCIITLFIITYDYSSRLCLPVQRVLVLIGETKMRHQREGHQEKILHVLNGRLRKSPKTQKLDKFVRVLCYIDS